VELSREDRDRILHEEEVMHEAQKKLQPEKGRNSIGPLPNPRKPKTQLVHNRRAQPDSQGGRKATQRGVLV